MLGDGAVYYISVLIAVVSGENNIEFMFSERGERERREYCVYDIIVFDIIYKVFFTN